MKFKIVKNDNIGIVDFGKRLGTYKAWKPQELCAQLDLRANYIYMTNLSSGSRIRSYLQKECICECGENGDLLAYIPIHRRANVISNLWFDVNEMLFLLETSRDTDELHIAELSNDVQKLCMNEKIRQALCFERKKGEVQYVFDWENGKQQEILEIAKLENFTMHKTLSMIRILIFTVILLLLGIFVNKNIPTVRMSIFVYYAWMVFVVCLAVLVMVLLLCRKVSGFVVDIINAGLFIVLLMELFAMPFANVSASQEWLRYQGNNVSLGAYEMEGGIVARGEDSLEKAIEKSLTETDSNLSEIYRSTCGNRISVFFQGDNSIERMEFFREEERYYKKGSSKLIYYGFINFDYSDVDTVRQDIAYSMLMEREPLRTDGPIWGVSEAEGVKDMRINGVKADDVIQITNQAGEPYYFWVITDSSRVVREEPVSEWLIESLDEEN